jgi:hypothetical protein
MASLVSRTTTTNEEMIMKLVNHRNKSIDSGRKISFTQVASLAQNRIEERNFEMLRTENKLPKKRNMGAAKLALKNNGLAYPCYSDSAKAARKYAHTTDGDSQRSLAIITLELLLSMKS